VDALASFDIVSHHAVMRRRKRAEPGPRVALRLLIDTNVFISAEPHSDLPADVSIATELIRLAAEQRHQVFVHPATRDDLLEGTDERRRALRMAQLGRYPILQESPIPDSLVQLAGASEPGSNDHRDLRLLAALNARAVTHLVSNDQRFRKRARRAGLADSFYTAHEALQYLLQLVPYESPPPPLVSRIPAYTLDTDQAIFESLRIDYPDFDKWLDTVRSQSDHRPCFLVTTGGAYVGLALLKHETECEYPLPQPVVKVSTFKVDPDRSGFKYGELLLKSIFTFAHEQRTASMYVTAFERHDGLLALLTEFGFKIIPDYTTGLGELVLGKRLRGNRDASLDSLEFHKTYGPPAVMLRSPAWAIPIEPRWHDQLFPDAPQEEESQLVLPGLDEPDPKPWGNALRKAYLCHSKVTRLGRGDVVAFYRSRDVRSFTVLGVVEATLRSNDPLEVMGFVGKRTVYTPDDIAAMCLRGPVLAILFRQDRFMDPPWSLDEVCGAGLLRSHPQSVTELRREGISWLGQQLAEWP
jgi:GNAT superfamily N-acetyltransferase